ncbi:type III-A CRISPR-associated RAMP protein Csm4 [Synechococcus sp. PCC 7336]|uniref:type III-A CRISPR-associated RAMP protein Csm4 n=1 Tax=Synechococcus sp. PCC 7336 TaxID=195250 RepID=UPI000346E086|nr:type III-A CRISPR-associated RAMP protein Csm4 [Synechococcus sp. PCC 7336]
MNFGRSPTHFGELGIGLEQTSERVRSDTLFSAWVSAYAKIFQKEGVEALLARFNHSPAPPFRVSSTFVYRREGDRFIDYLPKLVERPNGYPDNDLAFAKTYRKLAYLPLPIWRRWYQGGRFTPSDAAELAHYSDNPSESSSLSLFEAGCFSYGDAFESYELPKVSIDRTTRATNFYHTGYTQFAWEAGAELADVWEEDWNDEGIRSLAGLYFLLELPEESPELEEQLRQALMVLGEEGIGGERSSGAGRFRVAKSWQLPEHWQAVVEPKVEADRHALLSLFYQAGLQSSWLGEEARYAIQERGGWIASPFSGRQLRRKRVRMFAEGSVFPQKPEGQLADVTPEQFTLHPIYRNGIAVSLPVKLKAAS